MRRSIAIEMENPPPYLRELESCELCEWRCGVNRLAGELGVCRMTTPLVASCQLHPAPPQSYTIFLAGCNFRCLGCQNNTIAHYPDQEYAVLEGFVDPKLLARESLMMIRSPMGRLIRADRIFFSGGEPTIHLPYVEEVVRRARETDPEAKVNFDTNGFMTKESLRRVISFATSITFDIKAYSDEVHRAVTGAPVEPVLRNAEIVAREARDRLWEFRILVTPGIVDEEEVSAICEFIASIDPSLPVCFLAFRPNFALDRYWGAPFPLMERCVEIAAKCGLENVHWSGHPGIRGLKEEDLAPYEQRASKIYSRRGAVRAGALAMMAGCVTHPRSCGSCSDKHSCALKKYQPLRWT